MRRETAPEVLSNRLTRLRELEERIEKDLDAWIRMGLALREIRDDRLYLETHKTFEEWAKERFQISRPRAYQLIDALKVRDYLSTMVGAKRLPANERQARSLSPLNPESQIAAWERVLETVGDEREILEGDVKKAVREIKHEARLRHLAQISKGDSALNTAELYPVILADPPWRYDDSTADPSRQIENQYPTMDLGQICELRIGQNLATQDAVLFLWATAPLLPEALVVMEQWGFSYRSNAVWDKVRIGMGYWFRGRHEHLLVGVRGDPPKPSPSNRHPSIVKAMRGEHSKKPGEVHELIESYYPELPKLELFARAPREGWAVWGMRYRHERPSTGSHRQPG